MDIRIGDFKTTTVMRDYVNEILDNNRITEHCFVKRLEEKMAKFLGVKHAIAVTNGTLSLEMLGHYLRMSYGQLTVCVPALTFPATINAFINTGHKVILCDVKEDLTIDLDTLSKEDRLNINVIVPVHLMGYSCDMDKVLEFKTRYGWDYIIEDCAESFGSKFNNKKVGTIGDFGSFSFYVSHNIAGGELGLVVTNNDEDAKILRSIKNHGRDNSSPLEFKHDYVGSNYKITEFVAAIGLANMNNVEEILKKRFDNAIFYKEHITNNRLSPFNVTKNDSLLGYPIKVIDGNIDVICKLLNDNGIETRKMFPCLANQKAYNINNTYDVATELEQSVFYVGVHHLLSDIDKKKIVTILNSYKGE